MPKTITDSTGDECTAYECAALAEYECIKSAAWSEYQRTEGAALDKFFSIINPAWDKYRAHKCPVFKERENDQETSKTSETPA